MAAARPIRRRPQARTGVEPPAVDALAGELARLRLRLEEGGAGPAETLAAVDCLRRVAGELHAAAQEVARRRHELADLHAELAEERHRYRDLFELAPDAYLVTDAAGTIVEANHHACVLFDVAADALIGASFATRVHVPDRQPFARWLGELRRERTPQERDVRMRRRDGDVVFDAAVTVAPTVRDPGEEPATLRWIVRDVSDDREAGRQLVGLNAELDARVREQTAALQAQAALLTTVLEQLPIGVAIARAPSGTITAMSGYGFEVVGKPSPGETVHTFPAYPIHRVGEDAPVEPAELPIARALRGEQVADEIFELHRPDGERRLVVASARPVRDAEGELLAAVVVFADVTEQERRDAAERAFVTHAAHELQTPLTAIASAVEVLLAGAKDVPDERDLFLGHVEREVDRLARLARALLVLARAESGTEPPKLEIVPLRPLLRAVAADLRPAPDVSVAVRCGHSVAALSNPDLLEQVLVNLAGNAVRYTTSGHVTISARVRGPHVVVEVKDTGRGIPVADRERIFDRFYRGASTDREGFGLGLSITREAVRAVRGSIELESDEGRGTTVRVRLPPARLMQT